MTITAGTNITGIQIPEIGVDPAPTWAQALNDSLGSSGIDGHDHTANKGSRITPAAINVNADLPLNSNDLTEVRTVSMDATSGTGTGDVRAIYADASGNLKYRNSSGVEIGITSGSSIVGAAGTITGMTDATPNAAASFAHGTNTYSFYHNQDSTVAKMSISDVRLYKYVSGDGAASADYVSILVNSAASGSSGTLTVPLETGTFLTTATSFSGTINVATSSGNAPINLKPNGSGHVVIGNAGATGKLTSNGAYDLILDTNSGTNSGSITITDGADAAITITPNGSGSVVMSKVDINGGTLGAFTIDGNWTAASQTCADLGSVTTCDINGGAVDSVTLGTNSAVTEAQVDNININGNTISSTDSNGDINLDCNGTGDIECAADVKTSTTKKLYSKGNCYQTSFHASLVFGY
jgi:hypothetical protein